MPSDHSEGETPVPIPNTEVKSFSADGTILATGWESRKSLGFFVFAVIGALLLFELPAIDFAERE